MNTSHCRERVKEMEFSDCISTVAVTFFQMFWLSLERLAAVLLNERSGMSSVISIDEANASVCNCPLALMSRRCLSLVLYMCQ